MEISKMLVAKLCEIAPDWHHKHNVPSFPECSKTSTMSNIVKSAKFVFKLMTGPVTTTSSTAGQSVMRKTSCPHDLCSCIVVTRFVQQDSCIVNNGLHQGFTDTVSDLHGFDVDKSNVPWYAEEYLHSHFRSDIPAEYR